MLAASHYSSRHPKSRVDEHHWTDNHSIRIPWLNFLTSQPIPEESDVSESTRYGRSDSDNTLSSMEDCYIVLEAQNPRATTGTAGVIDERLSFAQINEDEPHGQLVQPLFIEIPPTEHAVEHRVETTGVDDEREKVVQRTNYILFHTMPKSDTSSCISDEDSSSTNERAISEGDSLSRSVELQGSMTSVNSIDSDSLLTSLPTAESPEMVVAETKTLIRTFAFDHACTEKYHRVQEQKIYHLDRDADPSTSASLSKPSTLLRLLKDRTRSTASKYTFSSKETRSAEPTLLNIKYLDGRPDLVDANLKETQNLSRPSSSRLSLFSNRSGRQRIFSHFQTLFKTSSKEQTRPPRTISRLFLQRRSKVTIC